MRSIQLTIVVLTAVTALALASTAHAASIVIVTPNANATVEGNSGNSFPFGSSNHRYQQIYGAEAFTALPGPSSLETIAFRPNGANTSVLGSNLGKAFSGIYSMTLSLSTSPFTPDNLPSTFAAAHGPADLTQVIDGHALSSSFTGPAGGPKDFDVILTLESPFTYDPAQGSLLIDVRIFGVSEDLGGFFDSQVTTGDSVSRSWVQNYNSGGGNRDTTALVTQFTFTPGIPAPAAWAAAPLLGALALRRRHH